VRLEMRSVAGVAVAALGLLLSGACCCKPPFLIGDAVSGGPGGSPFVKVSVILAKSSTGSCRVAEVLPDRVHVFPGSAIRWKVNNACDETSGRRHLKFTPPRPKRSGSSEKAATTGVSAAAVEGGLEPWSFANCVSELDLGPQKDGRNVLLCEVPEGVRPGLYKYGLEGDIEPYDPDVDVHKGGGR